MEVSKIVVHSSYSSTGGSNNNNIALWKLAQPVSTSDFKLLCLPQDGSSSSGQAALVGWRISEIIGYRAMKIVPIISVTLLRFPH